MGRHARIAIEVCEVAGSNDGLNEFISAMLPSRYRAEPNLRYIPLHHPKYAVPVPSRFVLYREISMLELSQLFPREVHALKNLYVLGERPYAAVVSAFIDLTTTPNLDAFQKSPSFVTWKTFPGQPE